MEITTTAGAWAPAGACENCGTAVERDTDTGALRSVAGGNVYCVLAGEVLTSSVATLPMRHAVRVLDLEPPDADVARRRVMVELMLRLGEGIARGLPELVSVSAMATGQPAVQLAMDATTAVDRWAEHLFARPVCGKLGGSRKTLQLDGRRQLVARLWRSYVVELPYTEPCATEGVTLRVWCAVEVDRDGTPLQPVREGEL